MKKIIYSSLALASLAASSVIAQDCSRPLHGFTFGAGIGYDTSDTKTRRDYEFSPNNTDKLHLSSRGAQGQINLGYGFYAGGLYLAPEIFGALSSASSKNSEFPIPLIQNSIKLHQRGTFGANLRIGKSCHGVLPFLSLGYANTKFQLLSDSLIDPTEFKGHKNVSGFRAGLGVFFPMSKHFGMEASWNATIYNKFHQDHTDTALYTLRAVENTAIIGVKYNFFTK